MMTNSTSSAHRVVTRNSCKLCAPLGASLVFAGIEKGMSLLHGSQGCATYIRRYLISHFREPLDIASSSFTEETAVYGGKDRLCTALDNVTEQYHPGLIGVTSTCLAETMGENTSPWIDEWVRARKAENREAPVVLSVSAPSYQGSHREGFQKALAALIRFFCSVPRDANTATLSHRSASVPGEKIAVLSSMLSPADQRWIGETFALFGLPLVLIPDYSLSLDGGPWTDFRLLPEGGTKLGELMKIRECRAVIELGALPDTGKTGGQILSETNGSTLYSLPLPIGIKNTDLFLSVLSELSGRPVPVELIVRRNRLLDTYIDAHKYVFGVKTLLYGEEDLVSGLAAFINETGMIPVVCATGGRTGYLRTFLEAELPEYFADGRDGIVVESEADFIGMEELIIERTIDLMIGNSKGYKLADRKNIPLLRAGFPIHDRLGGSRILHLGYEGAQRLFDELVNILLARRQADSIVGYTYY